LARETMMAERQQWEGLAARLADEAEEETDSG
jgi:hypothetical protein